MSLQESLLNFASFKRSVSVSFVWKNSWMIYLSENIDIFLFQEPNKKITRLMQSIEPYNTGDRVQPITRQSKKGNRMSFMCFYNIRFIVVSDWHVYVCVIRCYQQV